jgi:hypothetical protein
MIAVYCPRLAELLAVSVSEVFAVEGFGEKDAVTPAGSPETEKLTVPENPYCGFTKTEVEPELPWPMFTP